MESPTDKEQGTKWGAMTIALKVLAFIVPWALISVSATRHANVGYSLGLLVGIVCMHFVPPRGKYLSGWLLGWIVLSVLHAALVARGGFWSAW